MSLLLLFQGGGIVLAGAATFTLSAPEAVGVGSVLSAGGNTITLSAPVAAGFQTLTANGNTITFSAPTATGVAANIVAAAGTQPLTFSSPQALLTVVGGTDLYAPNIQIAGVTRSTYVDRYSVQISDILNDQVNTAMFTMRGLAPTRGEAVKIYLGIPTIDTLLFSGIIQAVDQIYEGSDRNIVAYNVTCVGDEWLLDGEKVSKVYPSQSATAIAIDLTPAGFTTVNIEAGLPTVDGFTCIQEDRSRAMRRLMDLIGGYYYVLDRDVHAFITEAVSTPTPLASDVTFSDIVKVTDISQVRNRVRVEGEGSQALVARIPGDTNIPVSDGTKFAAAGGLAKRGPQRLTYTGREIGGLATTVVGNISGPGGGLTAALGTGPGEVTAGTHTYKVAFGNSTGETLPGGASNTITAIDFVPPGSVATFTPVSGALGKLAGAYLYKLTFVTGRGETTGSGSASTSATAVAAPGALTTTEVSSVIGKLIGDYNYKVTFVTALGETLGGTLANRTVAAQTAPGAPTVGTHTAAGPLIGTYKYKIGFVSALGETIGTATGNTVPVATVPSTPSVSGDGTGNKIRYKVTYVHPVYGESALSGHVEDTNHAAQPVVTVVDLPTGCGWNIYSTGSFVGDGSALPYFKVGEAGIGVATFTHTLSGLPEGVRPSLGKNIPLSSIPTGPTGTLARRIYRTKAGGSAYYLVDELPDNTTTTFTDTVPDSSLTTSAPLENLNGKQISLTSIPTGPSGVVLARRIYRTIGGGAEYKLLVELPDNTATTFTDNVGDVDLGPEMLPLVSTAGGEQLSLTFVATGATGTIARRIWRTVAGGSEYKFVGQISDNVTTTFVDNVADSELGETMPLVNSAGSSVVDLTSISTGGAGVEKRILYRTKAGGSDFFYLDTIPNNTATTYQDNRADSALGELAPIVSTIGAQAGDLSIVLKSASGVPSSGWIRSDSQLISYTGKTGNTLTGIPPIKSATLTRSGQIVTATVTAHGYVTGRDVTVEGATQAEYNGTFTITNTGANTFTYEILGTPVTPATGTITVAPIGALRGSIRGGSTVVTLGMITGIPTSGTGSILYRIKDGEDVAILVEVEDTTAQAALATLLGLPSGVREHFISNGSLTIAEATATATADLSLHKDPETRITYKTRDVNTRSGKSIVVSLGAPQNISGTFKIQTVQISQIGIVAGLYPLRTVTASTTKYSFEDLLRRTQLAA